MQITKFFKPSRLCIGKNRRLQRGQHNETAKRYSPSIITVSVRLHIQVFCIASPRSGFGSRTLASEKQQHHSTIGSAPLGIEPHMNIYCNSADRSAPMESPGHAKTWPQPCFRKTTPEKGHLELCSGDSKIDRLWLHRSALSQAAF